MKARIKKFAKHLYFKMPYYYRSDLIYRKYYQIAQKNEFIDRLTFDHIQLKRLKDILEYSYRYVPYYRNLFKKIRLCPEKINDIGQIQAIPILEKSTVQQYSKDFISTKIPKDEIISIYSGGSTGVPAEYKCQKTSISIERAFMHKQWSRVGFNHKLRQRTAILRGIKPVKGDYEVQDGNLILSSYIADENSFDKYVSVIEKFNPDFIHAYPSIIYLWAKYITDNEITISLPNLKAIFLGSENLFQFQRIEIEKAFKKRVFSWYGHTEKGCLAGECEISCDYHIFPDYGYAEVEGSYVDKSEIEGNLIVTSFQNVVMPLIRFNTEDSVVMSDSVCSCGRGHRLIKKVNGRTNEYLIDAKGKIIPANVLLPYELIDLFREVYQYKFIQEFAGETEFIIKVTPNFTDKHLSLIRTELQRELGVDMKIKISIVQNIPRTKAGKLTFLDTSRRDMKTILHQS